MNGVKGVLESRTIWAAVLVLAASGLGLWGYSVTPEDQSAVVELLASLGGIVGAFGAIYWRIKASKKIGSPS